MSLGNRRAHVLVMMSGSISAYKVCHVLSRLKQAGHEVEVVASPAVLRFVGEATIEGLTGRPVRKAMFGTGAHMSHIGLIRWADVAIVCPATANTINKLSQGVGDDLITTLFLAHDFTKPWLIAPAMNSKMYHHPVTQAAVAKLKGMGCEILETASGVLACGEVGDGKLLDSELLLGEILARLPEESTASLHQPLPKTSDSKAPGRRRRVLITSGGTEEPIDPVRSITNKSTGNTGARIAEVLLGLGHDVYFLSARNSVQPEVEALGALDQYTSVKFTTYQDLARELERTLRTFEFDAIVHAAAVSDYSLADGPSQVKNDSAEEMTIRLKKNPKLLNSIRAWSKNPEIKVIAFKLTATNDHEERDARLEKLMKSSNPDFVVANDQSELPAWTLFGRGSGKLRQGEEREELGLAIEGVL